MLSEEGPVFRNRPLFRTFLASGSACNFRGFSPRTAACQLSLRVDSRDSRQSTPQIRLSWRDMTGAGLHCRNGRSCSPI